MGRTIATACALAAALGLSACGGGGGVDDSSEPATVAGVTSCVEDAGAHTRKIDVSFIDPAPNLSAEFSNGDTSTIWVTESDAEATKVVDTLNKVNEGDPAAAKEGDPIQVGNAVAAPFAGPLTDETRSTIEDCFTGA
jgi:hypothetical protein